MRHSTILILACLIYSPAISKELLSLPGLKGNKFELMLPAKFLCVPQNGVGYIKEESSSKWVPSLINANSNDSFIFTVNKIKSFNGEENDLCADAESDRFPNNNSVHEASKEMGYVLCGIKNYHLHPQKIKLAEICNITGTKEYKGLYCDNLVLNITDRNFFNLPSTNFILALGKSVISQGLCTAIP